MGWQLIETAPKGKKILAAYQNRYGKWRRIIARYYLPGTLVAGDDDETADENGYAKEGWYEESETHDFILPCDCPPTHWQELSAPPNAGVTGAEPRHYWRTRNALSWPQCRGWHMPYAHLTDEECNTFWAGRGQNKKIYYCMRWRWHPGRCKDIHGRQWCPTCELTGRRVACAGLVERIVERKRRR